MKEEEQRRGKESAERRQKQRRLIGEREEIEISDFCVY